MAVRALILSAALLSATPDEATLARTRQAALQYFDRLQNFICTQITTRSYGASPVGPRWNRLETQEWEIHYFDRRETTASSRERQRHETRREGQARPLPRPPAVRLGTSAHLRPQGQAEFEWDAPNPAAVPLPRPASHQHRCAGRERREGPAGPPRHGLGGLRHRAVTRFLTETDRGEAGSRRIAVGFRLEVRYASAAIGDREYLLPQSPSRPRSATPAGPRPRSSSATTQVRSRLHRQIRSMSREPAFPPPPAGTAAELRALHVQHFHAWLEAISTPSQTMRKP